MTEPTIITQLTPLEGAEQALATEATLEDAVQAAASTYLFSGEDKPLADGTPGGPLWLAYSAVFDQQVVQAFLTQETCAAAGREGWLLWEARADARKEHHKCHGACFSVRYGQRAEYKLAQDPALALNANEWKQTRKMERLAVATAALEVERVAEVGYVKSFEEYLDSDEDTPLMDENDGPTMVVCRTASDALTARRQEACDACSDAGPLGLDLWYARTPARDANRLAIKTLSDECALGRADYKMRQEPAVPLTPAEYCLVWLRDKPEDVVAFGPPEPEHGAQAPISCPSPTIAAD